MAFQIFQQQELVQKLACQVIINSNVQRSTSVAALHVSDATALLKGAHPKWSPSTIRSAMMTTADVLDNTQNPIKDMDCSLDFASSLAMGARQVNPNKALDLGLVYDATPQDNITFCTP